MAIQDHNALRTLWQNVTNVPISRTLVNLPLVWAGYHARRSLWKPLLSQGHLQWARDHLHLQLQHWNHVIFRDKARFEVFRKDGHIRVRRRVEGFVTTKPVYCPEYKLVVVASLCGGLSMQGGKAHLWFWMATSTSSNTNTYWKLQCCHLLG